MGASQSVEESDNDSMLSESEEEENDEGDEEDFEQDEGDVEEVEEQVADKAEIEQEPEIRPFNHHPQSPIVPQLSFEGSPHGNREPYPEPLQLLFSHIVEEGMESEEGKNDDLKEERSYSIQFQKPAEILEQASSPETEFSKGKEENLREEKRKHYDNKDFRLGSEENSDNQVSANEKATAAFQLMSSMRPSAIEIYFIRHGEAAHNLNPSLVGGRSPSSPLTPNGIMQSVLLGKFLRDVWNHKFDAVFSSPLIRAKQTAEIACKEMGFDSKIIQLDERLEEMSQGEWEEKHRSEVYTPDMIQIINALQPDFKAPGGESQRQVEIRMLDFLNDIVVRSVASSGMKNESEAAEKSAFNLSVGVPFGSEQTNGTNGLSSPKLSPTQGSDGVQRVSVFTHGGAIKCLLRGILNSDHRITQRMGIDNTSITLLKYVPNIGWHVLSVNQTSHLTTPWATGNL